MATVKGRLDLSGIVRAEAIAEVDLYQTGTVQNTNTVDPTETEETLAYLARLDKQLSITASPNPNDWEVRIIAYRVNADGRVEMGGNRG